jgi:hypothetical protein
MPGIVAHVYSPSNSGGSDRRITVEGQQREKLRRHPTQQIIWAWWGILVVLAMQDVIGRRIVVQASPGRNTRSCLKND